jgi:CRISPR-associated protein Csm2
MNTSSRLPFGLSQEQVKAIVQDPSAAAGLVQVADKMGNDLARQLSTSQIRSLFGEVRRIEGDWLAPGDTDKDKKRRDKAWRSLILLKPKMAYRAKRERGRGVEELVAVLSPAIDYVDGDTENFRRFVEFFEAILAYHKAHGGN